MGAEARREYLPIPPARHDAAAIARELVGEILRIADAEDLCRRVVPETPGRKGDRGHQRFEMPRRQVERKRPIEFVVLNCCVTETKDTACASNISTSRAKSASDRVSR